MSKIHRTVSIQFTRSTKRFPIFAWIIQAVQRTKYSHVRVTWKAMGEVPVIYEASGSSLKFIGPLSERDNPVEIVKEFKLPLNVEHYRKLVKRCMTYANISYGKKQVLGIGLTHLFGLKSNPFADGESSQVCSEVIGRFLVEDLGWDIKRDLDVVGPREIFEALEHHIKGS